jgi:hypothetical protein
MIGIGIPISHRRPPFNIVNLQYGCLDNDGWARRFPVLLLGLMLRLYAVRRVAGFRRAG